MVVAEKNIGRAIAVCHGGASSPPIVSLACLLLVLPYRALGDVYMNNPRGSNNKLSEQSNNAQNQNRLFDSQNNAAAGYQIGDNCKPVCLDGNNYDATKEGAMQGTMTYYQGSELYIEWHMQHGCGVFGQNLRCQVILQYMTEADNPSIRDGTKRGNQNTAGGEQEPPTAADAADVTLGQHEPLDFYLSCKERERNKGLYIADQNVRNDRGATATRQNPGGNGNNDRHGLECPEERDYYPYWHPTPWHDIIVFTEDTDRCAYYREESQNVRAKGECSLREFNNAEACSAGGGAWQEQPAFDEPPPECLGGLSSRDNHNGNVRNGHAMYHVWQIPEHVSGRTVLRLRYNITTKDFDADALSRAGESESQVDPVDQFFVDATFDPVITNDPREDFLDLGAGRELQVQLDTNQAARTFEDRSHTFIVRERPADVPSSARIVNYNVRGRRGNIVQVYPSVEYDFVPEDLSVDRGTYLHFQWTGSDANQQNNAGNGRAGTDRSNLVQVASRGENIPLPVSRHTLFFNAEGDASSSEGRALVDRFAYLDQDTVLQAIDQTCDPDENNDNNLDNCKQLNGASAYFDGGLVEMTQIGVHHVASTRNNDFSNRSQKATIRVRFPTWEWYSIVGLAAGVIVAVAATAYLCVAIYALKHPTSILFSHRYRPRVLRCLVRKETLDRRVGERRAGLAEERQKLQAERRKNMDVEAATGPLAQPTGARKETCGGLCLRRAHRCGVHEHRLFIIAYAAANALVFAIGAALNFSGGFMGSYAYPLAKGAGFTLDLNFSIVVLPTLKMLQTAMRLTSGTREWMPIDDPIYFHIVVACFIGLGSLVHVGAHVFHICAIAAAPPLQRDPLELFALSADEQVSGTPWWEQLLLNYRVRFAPLTGVAIAAIMAAMYATALPCVRRGTNACARRLGGYNAFWRVHASWKLVYVLLLVHGPIRLWIWLFFPAILIMLDRVMLASRRSMYVKLRKVKLLPRDVIGLTFQAPRGFAYQAGQYIHLGWRGEFHPFTLTSAPEERYLSVHIRASASLDWCSALRRRLVDEAPAEAAAAAKAEHKKAQPGTEIEYAGVAVNDMVYCRPSAPSGLRNTAGAAGGLEKASSRDTWDSSALEEQLPRDAVVLQLTGPFGAPAQKVWQFEVVMVVGAGIGVTPFASIMRSVQLRTLQRQALLKSGSAAPAPSKWWDAVRGSTSTAPATPGGAQEVTNKLLEDVITVPKKIYFYWIVRSQEEVDWFYDLLAAAADGPAKDIIEIFVFTTGEVELSSVKKLPCSKGQYFGRPQWGRIFKEKGAEHKGKHVGVFLCGSPLIGAELDRQSKIHTDTTGSSNGTRFSFFPEHF